MTFKEMVSKRLSNYIRITDNNFENFDKYLKENVV